MPDPDLSKVDDPQYLFNRRKVNEQYGFGRTANDYAQEMERQRNQRSNDQLGYQYKRARENTAYSAANRGFGQQGRTYQRAFQDYTQNKNTAFEGAANANKQNMYQLSQQLEEMTRNRDYTLQGLDLTEAERKAALASSLRDVQSNASGGGAGGNQAGFGQLQGALGNADGKGAGGLMGGGQTGTGTNSDPYKAINFTPENMDQFPQLQPQDKYWIVYNTLGPDAAAQYAAENGL